MSGMHDDDLDQILRLAFPQGTAVLRHENGTELLRHGARSLIGSPGLAYEVLGAKATEALGQALLTLGERYAQCARRMLELAAAGEPSASIKGASGASYSTEVDQ